MTPMFLEQQGLTTPESAKDNPNGDLMALRCAMLKPTTQSNEDSGTNCLEIYPIASLNLPDSVMRSSSGQH